MLSRATILILSLLLLIPSVESASELNAGERQESLELSLNEFIQSETRKQSPVPSTHTLERPRRYIPFQAAAEVPSRYTVEKRFVKLRKLRI